MESDISDYYVFLGVSRSANEDTIRRAYRQQALRIHPDKTHHLSFDEQQSAQKKFTKLNEALEVLTNYERRKKHDQQIAENDAKQKRQAEIQAREELEGERIRHLKKVLREQEQRAQDEHMQKKHKKSHEDLRKKNRQWIEQMRKAGMLDLQTTLPWDESDTRAKEKMHASHTPCCIVATWNTKYDNVYTESYLRSFFRVYGTVEHIFMRPLVNRLSMSIDDTEAEMHEAVVMYNSRDAAFKAMEMRSDPLINIRFASEKDSEVQSTHANGASYSLTEYEHLISKKLDIYLSQRHRNSHVQMPVLVEPSG